MNGFRRREVVVEGTRVPWREWIQTERSCIEGTRSPWREWIQKKRISVKGTRSLTRKWEKKTFKSYLKSKVVPILNYPNEGHKSLHFNIAQFHVNAARSAFCKIIFCVHILILFTKQHVGRWVEVSSMSSPLPWGPRQLPWGPQRLLWGPRRLLWGAAVATVGATADTMWSAVATIGASAATVGATVVTVGAAAATVGAAMAATVGAAAVSVWATAATVGAEAATVGFTAATIGATAATMGTEAVTVGVAAATMGGPRRREKVDLNYHSAVPSTLKLVQTQSNLYFFSLSIYLMCVIYTVQRTSNFFLCLLHSCNVLFGMFYYHLWLTNCTYCIVFILHIKCRVALRPQ